MVPRQQSGNKAVKAARATRPLGQQGRQGSKATRAARPQGSKAAWAARVTETITFYFQTKKNFRLDSSQIPQNSGKQIRIPVQ